MYHLIIPCVCTFALSWLVFFATSAWAPSWDNLQRSRVPSFIHACVLGGLALASAPAYLEFLLGARLSELWSFATRFEESWQAAAIGYFLWDLQLMATCPDVFQWAFVAHHATVICSMVVGICYGGSVMNCLFVLHELTLPFTNIHYFLKKDSPWRVANGVAVRCGGAGCSAAYAGAQTNPSPPPPHTPARQTRARQLALSFFFFRIVVVVLVMRSLLLGLLDGQLAALFHRMPNVICVHLALAVSMAALDFYWFVQIVRMIAKALVVKKKV